MLRRITLLAAAAAVFISVPAVAAVTLATNNGQLATHINSSTVGGAPQDATTVWGSTLAGGGSHDVNFYSSTALHISPGAGYAAISDPDDIHDITAMIVDPLDAFNFSAIDFSIQTYADSYIFVQYMLAGGVNWLTPTGLGDPFFQEASELNDYIIQANAGEVLGAIRFSTCSTAGNCTSDGLFGTGAGIKLEKQNSITLASVPAVPEPGTWALMLLGFAAVGAGLRRSRKRGAQLLQIV